MLRRAFICLMTIACLPAFAASPERSPTQQQLWATLQSGGHVIFIRHAITVPGIGDPAHFKLDDCSTQRNLSDQGRADAKRIGAAFRLHQIPLAGVWASRWCRCVETAQLAFGSVQPAAMLDSTFIENSAGKEAKVRAVYSFVNGAAMDTGNLVFVTHAQNIQELTGVYLSSGEMVVTKLDGPSKFRVLGRISVLHE